MNNFKAESVNGGFRFCKKFDQADHYANQFAKTTGQDSSVMCGDKVLRAYTVSPEGRVTCKDLRTGSVSACGQINKSARLALNIG
jgi:hypothetical protein